MQFLDEVVFMPVACRQFWGPDVLKTVIFHSCSLDKVADVPARAVHRWLWMSLCLCSDGGALAGGASAQFIAGAGGLSSFRDSGLLRGFVAMRG